MQEKEIKGINLKRALHVCPDVDDKTIQLSVRYLDRMTSYELWLDRSGALDLLSALEQFVQATASAAGEDI